MRPMPRDMIRIVEAEIMRLAIPFILSALIVILTFIGMLGLKIGIITASIFIVFLVAAFVIVELRGK